MKRVNLMIENLYPFNISSPFQILVNKTYSYNNNNNSNNNSNFKL